MFSFHARGRFVALAAAVPMLVAVGPIVSATAVVDPVSQAVIVDSLGGPRIGPRAGFRGDVSRGVNGTTAIFRVHVASSTVLNTVVVNVTETTGAFPIYRDFNNTDGFAVYVDTNDNGRLDATEYAAGAVSQPGYGVTGNGTAAVVTITADAAKATGSSAYLITAHPADGVFTDRTASFRVPIGGIATSDGTLPVAAVAYDSVIIDSAPPTAIPTGNFTHKSRIPTVNCKTGTPADQCGNDGYLVYLGGTAIEDGEKLAFFNTASDLSDAALLTKPGPALALYDVNGIPDASPGTEFSIGNGTGRNAAIAGSHALNNQISDDVYPVQWDVLGNAIALGRFTNDRCATPCTDPFPPLGNDVTGPKLSTSYTATMPDVTATSTETAVPVTGSVKGTDTVVPANTAQSAVTQKVTLQHVTTDGATVIGSADPVYSTTSVIPATSNPNIVTNVDAHDDDMFPEDEKIRGFAELLDVAGNATSALTAIQTKDTSAPAFASVSLVDTNHNGDPDPGEKYRVVFNDPMNTTTITSANVNTALVVKTSGGGACSAADGTTCPYWGAAPTVTWYGDARSLDITLDDPTCVPDTGVPLDCPPNSKRLAFTGDQVMAASTVKDPVGNLVTPATFDIGQPVVVPFQASTVDTLDPTGTDVFGTGRDGVVDTVDVDFSGALKASTVNATTAGKFKVSVPGDSVTPALSLINGGTTLRLAFAPSSGKNALWGTAVTPTVELTDGTVLQTTTNDFIAAFTMGALDRVAPVPVSIVTSDTPADGKLDKVLITYSEAIKPDAENPCGYTVSGYSNAAYSPPGARPSGPSTTEVCPTTPTTLGRNDPTSTGVNTVSLALKQLGTFDTGATPLVSFVAANQLPPFGPGSGPNNTAGPACDDGADLVSASSDPDCGVRDLQDNTLPSFSALAADGAGPAIVGRATADRNADGHLDEIDVTFSEALSAPSVGLAQFQVTAPDYTILQTPSLAPGSDTELRIPLVPSSARAGDTAEKPTLKFLGGTTDTASPPIETPADAAGVVTTDKAGPAIMAACVAMSFPTGIDAAEKAAELGKCPEGAGNKLALMLSEAVSDTSIVIGDFVVEQPSGTAKTVTGKSTANATDGKSSVVTLTFADNTLNQADNAFVKFSGAGVISDLATVANTSAQVSFVTAFGAPSVTLALTCPVASNPGYCSANYINTGANGSSGVTGWRLVDASTAPPLPAAGDFSATQPTIYPSDNSVLTEGLHTLWLRGKDDFDRISPQVSGAITVLKTPTISNVQFSNGTSGSSSGWPKMGGADQTVLDGDIVQIAADAQGSDAADWAAPSGGCLATYMSVDLRALTGQSNQSAVGPLKCDLKNNTAPPHRQMQFPFIKVMKTTKYPVGTVLRSATSGTEYRITDGPNNTQRRSRYISPNARRSWQIPDAQVIKVPTELLASITSGPGIGFRDGAVVRASGTGYYYVLNSIKRPISSATLAYLHIPVSAVYVVSAAELKAMATGTGLAGGSAHPVGTWIKFANGTIQQISRNASNAVVRRSLANSAALKTIVPSTQVYPANSKDAQLPLDSWVRGYRDGTLLKLTNNRYGVISRSSLRIFNDSKTFNSLGFSTSNAITANGAAMPHVAGSSYRTGATIDRYKITTVVIKVTNKAGAVATAIVTPVVGGIYGLGTLDAVPVGWDFTRS